MVAWKLERRHTDLSCSDGSGGLGEDEAWDGAGRDRVDEGDVGRCCSLTMRSQRPWSELGGSRIRRRARRRGQGLVEAGANGAHPARRAVLWKYQTRQMPKEKHKIQNKLENILLVPYLFPASSFIRPYHTY